MQTDELVRMLARGLEPTPPGAAQRRWTLALAASVPIAGGLMLVVLGLQPDLQRVATLPMSWQSAIQRRSAEAWTLSTTSRV